MMKINGRFDELPDAMTQCTPRPKTPFIVRTNTPTNEMKESEIECKTLTNLYK